MTKHPASFSPRRAAILLSTAALWIHAVPARAQQAAPTAGPSAQAYAASGEPFPFEIGHAAKAGLSCTISATQPASSKLTGQKVRLMIVDGGPTGTTTRFFTLASGKHKTVAELDAALVEIFRRSLANPPPIPGQELGKIGDAKHGGEVRFVATSVTSVDINILRFDNISPSQPVRTTGYSREDVATLLAALASAPPT